MMYEHKTQSVLPFPAFLRRLYCHGMVALAFMLCALLAGMCGYHYIENFSWIDSFLNAAMILGGMGEIDVLRTDAGKLFAGFFALFSGLWLVTSMGIFLAPVMHRILHHLHVSKT